MNETLMSDTDLKKFRDDFEKKYEAGIIKDYAGIKMRGEKFLHSAFSLGFGTPAGLINHMKLSKSPKETHFDWIKYRIFLGIGTEHIIKSAFVKKGYCINKYVSKDVGKKHPAPEKFEAINESELSKEHTHDFAFLIKHIDLIFPEKFLTDKECNTYIRKGLEIARVWRNKEIHVSSGYHQQGGEDIFVKNALLGIYDKVFDEKETIEKILNIQKEVN